MTARRAYDNAHRGTGEAVSEVPKGRRTRGRSTRLGPEADATIGRLLGQGVPIGEVARRAGCSTTTVRRRRKSRRAVDVGAA